MSSVSRLKAALALGTVLLLSTVRAVKGWEKLGSQLDFPYSPDSTVRISGDSRRMIVGSPSHQRLYDLQDFEWNLTGTLDGTHEDEFLRGLISISMDGSWFAASGVGLNGTHRVQAFSAASNGDGGIDFQQIGSDIDICDEIKSLQVGDAGTHWIIVGCGGEVRAYSFLPPGKWNLHFSPLPEKYPGSNFGDSITFSASKDDSLFWLAVSSPDFDDGRGMVSIYKAGDDDWSQAGTDLIGVEESERFGSSIGLGSTKRGDRYLVVGSPYHSSSSSHNESSSCEHCGAVQVFMHTANNFWSKVGHFIGPTKFDRSGQFVSISADAGRIFASDFNQGYIKVYDRIRTNFVPSSSIVFGMDNQNRIIDINAAGSAVAVGSSLGINGTGGKWTVRVLLDTTNFCSSFESVYGSNPQHILSTIADRAICRDEDGPIEDEDSCFEYGCLWMTGLDTLLDVPDSMPVSFAAEDTSPVSSFVGPSNPPIFPPSESPSNTVAPYSDGMPRLAACRCGDDGECLRSPLERGVGLKLCMDATDRTDVTLQDINTMSIYQGGFVVTLVENQKELSDRVFSLCIGNHCLAMLEVHDLFFLDAQFGVSSIGIAGSIAAELNVTDSEEFEGKTTTMLDLEFKIVVKISDPISSVDEDRDSSNEKSDDDIERIREKHRKISKIFSLVLAGILSCAVVLWVILKLYRKYKRHQKNSRVPDTIFTYT